MRMQQRTRAGVTSWMRILLQLHTQCITMKVQRPTYGTTLKDVTYRTHLRRSVNDCVMFEQMVSKQDRCDTWGVQIELVYDRQSDKSGSN